MMDEIDKTSRMLSSFNSIDEVVEWLNRHAIKWPLSEVETRWLAMKASYYEDGPRQTDYQMAVVNRGGNRQIKCTKRRTIRKELLYRYLVYSVDKHQSSPIFCNDLPAQLIQNANDGFDVIVDLREGKRYFRGDWGMVDKR